MRQCQELGLGHLVCSQRVLYVSREPREIGPGAYSLADSIFTDGFGGSYSRRARPKIVNDGVSVFSHVGKFVVSALVSR